MYRIEIPQFGGPEVLTLKEAADLQPGPGQVRVAVDAAGVNFADVMARMGLYDSTPPLPAVMGWESAGTVDAVGEGVSEDRIGDPVVVVSEFGSYATQVVVDSMQAVVRPSSMSAVVGAAVPVHGLSTWMMVEEMGRVRPGDRVLVHGVGGGVGLMLLQLCKHRGAFVAGTASSAKHLALQELGIDQVIDYRAADFYEVLKNEPGFDLALDPIGGESWRKSMDLLRSGGKLVCYGFADAITGPKRRWGAVFNALRKVPWAQFQPFALQPRNIGVFGMEMQHLWHERERIAGWLEQSVALVEQGVMVPRIHAQVPFSNASEAHRILHDRENFGKVVLVNDV